MHLEEEELCVNMRSYTAAATHGEQRLPLLPCGPPPGGGAGYLVPLSYDRRQSLPGSDTQRREVSCNQGIPDRNNH